MNSAYRPHRQLSDGPHPIVAYFDGGDGRSGAQRLRRSALPRPRGVPLPTIVSVADHRHAPEERFPAAVDLAGFAAVKWIADHAVELGGIPGQLAVGGWSAGADAAADVGARHRARHAWRAGTS